MRFRLLLILMISGLSCSLTLANSNKIIQTGSGVLIPTNIVLETEKDRQQFLKRVLILKTGDISLKYPLLDVDFIRFQKNNETSKLMDKPEYKISQSERVLVEMNKMDLFLESIGTKVNIPPQNLILKKNANKLILEGTAHDGRLLDKNALLKMINVALEKNINTILLPIGDIPGQVVNLTGEENDFKELISTGVSDFSGSTKNRIHNIRVGSSRYNGTIIEQAENFSFVAHLGGPVDGAHGYLPELVIKGKETIPEYGGGLCQVSTTMFRAALLAGLPINERKGHSYAVSYYNWPYGWGVDSTVYPGSADLKFTNDTPGKILVQTYLEGTKLYYKFYGRSDGRKVILGKSIIHSNSGVGAATFSSTKSLPSGKKVLKAYGHPGMVVSFSRNVSYSDRPPRNETYRTTYRAVGPVYLVGE